MPSPKTGRGTLFLIVGPSGAGKDSLIDAARAQLAGSRYVFARRIITRPSEAGGEAHLSVSEAEFRKLQRSGGLSLAWEAHGLLYGICSEVERDLARGAPVVANVSRTVIDDARRRLQPVTVVEITAPVPVLAARLAQRGRESAADIAARLQRAGSMPLSGEDVVTIVNDAELSEAAARFVAVLGGVGG